MKGIYWLSLLLFISSRAFAQDNLQPLIIKADSTMPGDYSKMWQKLEDNTGKLSIEQVSKPPYSNLFHFNNTSKSDFPVNAYWFRYQIKNQMDHTVNIAISSGAGYYELYVKSTGANWKHYQNGWLVPWGKRDGLKLIKTITLDVKPGEKIIVYQRQRINPFYFLYPQFAAPWGIDFTNRHIRQYYVDDDILLAVYPIEYIVIGIALLAALFNLFFFRIVRVKLYLLFSLMLIPYAINRFFDGNGPLDSGSTIFFLREIPFTGNLVFFITYDISFYYFFRFVSNYLELPDHFPLWNKLLKFISIYFLVIIIAPFLIYIIPDGWNHILILAQIIMRDIALLLLFVTFLFYATPKNFARYRVVFVLPFLLMRLVALALDIFYIFLPMILHSVASVTPAWISWVNNWWPLIELSSVSLMVLFFSFDLFQRFRHMQTKIANQALEREKERSQLIELQKIELEETVEERTAELKQSLSELKSTQNQLIQSEKMASLGELTAGIAHEIQNPLNFVNNFSEVNREMIGDLKMELKSGNMEEALVIAGDLEQNEEKINHHGRRADAIVKGMLQHSRGGSGQKEPTNINSLADEYLRLSYHGLRAKDKAFNAAIETDFDNHIGKININGQDIGRVILNLLNNAFYAVNEKSKQQAEGYEPTVTVKTKKSADQITVSVRDNGNGIPQKILDKIYQPFFTTKPTGQGTGLGLSMSYDIVKAHGGELRVETLEGAFTEFMVLLPLN